MATSFRHLLVLTMLRFLLAVLHLESLASQLNKRDVQDALEKLPKGLDDTYHEALQRIADQGPPSLEMANKVLYWISHAYRPLTVEELQCAIAVSPGLTAFDGDAITPMDTLVSVCGGLVTFDPQSRIIRLVHYTTQGFLENIRDSRFPTTQADITRTCLTYLSFDHPRYYDERHGAIIHNIQGSPFLRYAAQHWRDHLRASPGTNFNELILQILWQPVKVQCILQAMDDRGLEASHIYKDSNVPPLCAAAILGLESIVLLLLERGVDLTEPRMSHGGTAFTMALQFAQLEVIKVLIDRGASVNSLDGGIWAPLMLTMITARITNEKRAVATARLLLDRGADINFQSSFCPDPISVLMQAANCGYVHLVELFLAYDADVNLGVLPALHIADEAKPRISQLLIHHGADLEARGYNGKSPLLYRCGSTHPNAEETVRLLLERGADIHSRDNLGETALFKAARMGSYSIVQILLEHGADIHARSVCGPQLLSSPPEPEHLRKQEAPLFLEVGVDVNSRNSAGDTALTVAAAEGEREVVKLLLDHGANPHTKNQTGGTALSLSAENGHSEVHQLLLDHLSQTNHAPAPTEDE